MDSVQKSAKTIEEAIASALIELKITRDEAKIEIIETGSRGIFGIGAKPAKVLVTRVFDPEAKAKDFIRELASSIGVAVNVETVLSDKKLDIELSGKDVGVFIGKRGQTLESLQYIVNLVINKGDAPYIGVVIDIENYRQRRKDTLESLAYNLAKKVKATNKNVVLEPMSASERRIIHSALQNDKFVMTKSEGEEPYRNIVIIPKRNYKNNSKITTIKPE